MTLIWRVRGRLRGLARHISAKGHIAKVTCAPASLVFFVIVDTFPLQRGLLCMISPSPNMRLLRNGLGTFLVAFPAMVFIYMMLF